MLTLNQQIATIRTKANAHAQINTFYFGDPWEFGAGVVDAGGSILYPFCGLQLTNSSLNGNILTTSFKMFVCDLVHKDETNETEVLSDCNLIALDLFSDIEDSLYSNNIQVNEVLTLTPFTERFDDEVSGVECDIIIEQFYNKDTCQIPLKTT